MDLKEGWEMAGRTFLIVCAALMLGVSSSPGVEAQSCNAEKALEFDGVDDCVTIPFDLSLPAETFTLTAWIRSRGPTPETQRIVSYGEDSSTDNGRWLITIDAEGRLVASTENCAELDDTYNSGVVVADDTWHHVAATRNLSGSLRLFVDGSLVSTFASTRAPCSTAIQNPHVGCSVENPQGFVGFFFGTIDEVSIWNRPLSDARISEIVRKGISNPLEPGLVAYWRFDEAGGQTVFDQSSVGNDGFLGEGLLPDFRDPIRVDSDAPICATVTYDTWSSLSVDSPPHEPIHDCVRLTEDTISTDSCGDSGPLFRLPLLAIPDVDLWIGQVPCSGQNLFFVGTTLDSSPLPLGGRAIGASIIGLNTGITLGLEGVEDADCSTSAEANAYASSTASGVQRELSSFWSEGGPPTLEIGPAGTAQSVANKTYEIWFSQAFDLPPFLPSRDCWRFTDTTVTTDQCGDVGPLVEFPLFGVPGLSLWIGQVPCGWSKSGFLWNLLRWSHLSLWR